MVVIVVVVMVDIVVIVVQVQPRHKYIQLGHISPRIGHGGGVVGWWGWW